MGRVVFITGTDTGVGKTVLAVWLTRHLKSRGLDVFAVKPLCSGGRGDARSLQKALGGSVPLDRINPWFFRAAVAPWMAAQREGRTIKVAHVVRFLREARDGCQVLIVEGAGGLLSPLGEGFDSRRLIRELSAETVVVAPNRLGILNHVLMTWECLSEMAGQDSTLALMGPSPRSLVTRSNAAFLKQRLGPRQVVCLPHAPQWLNGTGALPARLSKAMDRWAIGGKPRARKASG